jgi:hypothetical protein
MQSLGGLNYARFRLSQPTANQEPCTQLYAARTRATTGVQLTAAEAKHGTARHRTAYYCAATHMSSSAGVFRSLRPGRGKNAAELIQFKSRRACTNDGWMDPVIQAGGLDLGCERRRRNFGLRARPPACQRSACLSVSSSLRGFSAAVGPSIRRW